MSIRRDSVDALRQLAERYGIASVYQGMDRATVRAPQESVFAALQALGADVATLDDVADAYERRRAEAWATICDPTATIWDGQGHVRVRLPSRHSTTELHLRLLQEDGEALEENVSVRDYKVVGSARLVPTSSILERAVELPWEIPAGYHQLEMQSGELSASVILISAPSRAFRHDRSRSWGTFLPLYSLTTGQSWGAGNIGDLGRLLDWTAERGGSYTGTLPLLPAFLDEPFEAGPYSPVSRLFWNEFYLDIPAIPEFEHSSDARSLVESADFKRDLANLRANELVDYREGIRLRRTVLEKLSATLIDRGGDRYDKFQAWLGDHLHARLYAAFRALVEQHGSGPSGWPVEIRPEDVTEAEYDQDAFNYHAYVQWIAEQQLDALPRRPKSNSGLYLDLPIGVNGEGYDVWRERESFAAGFTVGAPPDLLGPEGQNWGFPPLNPLVLREHGYRHFIEVIQHHMRHASLLRIDHIMGLHRQFWIPEGAEAKDGLYVHYPADDLYAILSLESHRNQTELIGEDLGTVPPAVRPAMEKHDISRMIIVPFEVWEDSTSLNEIPEGSLTALNTHDMPPVAGLWQDWFNSDRQATLVALLQGHDLLAADVEPDDLEAVIPATLEFLGRSDARAVLVNLEDLWFETRSQNIPGTTDDEHDNWRRIATRTFEEFSNSEAVLRQLTRLDSARRQTEHDDEEL